MKRLLIVVLLFASLVCAQSANAYLIKVQCCAPDGTAGSVTGSLRGSESSPVFTPLGAVIGPEAAYAIYENNDPNSSTLGHTLGFTTSPDAWYGIVFSRGGYEGLFDLRFCSTTTESKLATGTWYLYKGIQAVTNGRVSASAELLDSGSFTTSESTWATSTFGAILCDGDQWTLTTAPQVPEPASFVVILSAIGSLAGCKVYSRRH